MILYVFSLGTLFSAYYLNDTTFHDPVIAQSATISSMNDIVNSFTIPSGINASLIFGDFVKVYTLLSALVTGGVFSDLNGGPDTTDANGVVHHHPGLIPNSGFGFQPVTLLMGILFDSASFFFLLYIISNRSI